MFKTRKVVIVGAGHVGSHVALALIQSGEADDIVLIDILKEKAIGQALDLDDCVSGSLCGKDVSIRAGSYEELHDADIMVMAFGRSRRPGETRLDMFDDSIKMANEVVSHLKQVDFSRYHDQYFQSCGHHLRIHPAGQMDWAAFPLLLYRHQPGKPIACCGYSARPPATAAVLFTASVWVSMVIPALSSGHAFYRRQAFLQAAPGTSGFGRNQLEDLQTQVKKAGDIEIDGKGCTEFGIANVAKMLISAIFHDQKLVWPC